MARVSTDVGAFSPVFQLLHSGRCSAAVDLQPPAAAPPESNLSTASAHKKAPFKRSEQQKSLLDTRDAFFLI